MKVNARTYQSFLKFILEKNLEPLEKQFIQQPSFQIKDFGQSLFLIQKS